MKSESEAERPNNANVVKAIGWAFAGLIAIDFFATDVVVPAYEHFRHQPSPVEQMTQCENDSMKTLTLTRGDQTNSGLIQRTLDTYYAEHPNITRHGAPRFGNNCP